MFCVINPIVDFMGGLHVPGPALVAACATGAGGLVTWSGKKNCPQNESYMCRGFIWDKSTIREVRRVNADSDFRQIDPSDVVKTWDHRLRPMLYCLGEATRESS